MDVYGLILPLELTFAVKLMTPVYINLHKVKLSAQIPISVHINHLWGEMGLHVINVHGNCIVEYIHANGE